MLIIKNMLIYIVSEGFKSHFMILIDKIKLKIYG
jgi:hypothetical protein